MMTTLETSENLPNGGAWAAILAAGIGCAALGLLIDLGEGTKFFGNALNFYNPSGNLSGKTTVAIIVWVIAWAVLHASWKNKTVASPGAIAAVTVILVCLGVIAGSPFFFGLFSAG
jgi:hypothetical protein